MRAAKKKAFVVRLGLVATIFLLYALGSSPAFSAEKPPIKVGLLLPYTGIMPLTAKAITEGIELYFDEVGKKAGGRAIQVIKEDDENNPTVGLTKVRRLVEEQKVNFLIGPVNSAVALAIHPYIRQQKVVLIYTTAATRELTSPEKASENIFRVGEQTDQGNYPMAKWMVKNTPYRNIVLAGSDFAAGHHSLEAFKAGFQEAGGRVIKEVYPKMGTMDFAPFLSAIDTKGADSVYAWFAGTDAVRFVQQYEEFGLKKRLPLFGFMVIADDPYLPNIGDAALGIITSGHYTYAIDTPRNRAFVKAYTAKWGDVPSLYSEQGYVAAQLMGATAESLKGELGDISRVSRELKKVAPRIETPSGPLAFDKYNQRIAVVYILKVEKRDGKLINVAIDRIPNIAQEDVWKWWNK